MVRPGGGMIASMSANRATTAARRAQDVRRQIEEIGLAPCGFSWRDRAKKARVMAGLRAKEARLQRRARATPYEDEHLPF